MIELTDDIINALARMEAMDPEELDAFRSADHGGEFGAAHLEQIKEILRRDEEQVPVPDTKPPTATQLLAEVLKAEKGDPEGDPAARADEFLRTLAAMKGELEVPTAEPDMHGILLPTKLIVAVVIGRFVNGRQVGEFVMDGRTVMAHPTDPDMFQRGIQKLISTCEIKVMQEVSGPAQG